MKRRNRLKSIAHDLLGSFVSRNNELDGYWALGKLHAHALSHATSTVEIDLLAGRLTPPDAHCMPMVYAYAAMLDRLLSSAAIPLDQIRRAGITLQFNVPFQQAHYPVRSHARPFAAVLEIVDRHGNRHAEQRLGWCAPHDPRFERRSNRASKS